MSEVGSTAASFCACEYLGHSVCGNDGTRTSDNRSSLIESNPSEFDHAISGGRPPKAVEEGEKHSHLQRLLDATLDMLPPDEQGDALAVMNEFQVLRAEVLNADGRK